MVDRYYSAMEIDKTWLSKTGQEVWLSGWSVKDRQRGSREVCFCENEGEARRIVAALNREDEPQ